MVFSSCRYPTPHQWGVVPPSCNGHICHAQLVIQCWSIHSDVSLYYCYVNPSRVFVCPSELTFRARVSWLSGTSWHVLLLCTLVPDHVFSWLNCTSWHVLLVRTLVHGRHYIDLKCEVLATLFVCASLSGFTWLQALRVSFITSKLSKVLIAMVIYSFESAALVPISVWCPWSAATAAAAVANNTGCINAQDTTFNIASKSNCSQNSVTLRYVAVGKMEMDLI